MKELCPDYQSHDCGLLDRQGICYDCLEPDEQTTTIPCHDWEPDDDAATD